VWSHGYTGTALGHAHLGEYLAARGYVFAACDHNDSVTPMRITGPVEIEDMPATRRQAITDLLEGEFDHDEYGYRPMELALTIENLLLENDPEQMGQTPMTGMIDPDRIGAGGHSMGGYTVLTRIGCLPFATDERIKAAVLQSPATWMWGEQDYANLSVPTMYMIGQLEAATRADKIIDIETAFENTPVPTWSVEIERGGHNVFVDPRMLELIVDRADEQDEPQGHRAELAERLPEKHRALAEVIARYTGAAFDLTLKADDEIAVQDAQGVLSEADEGISSLQTKEEDSD
jgi:hypothetical protein